MPGDYTVTENAAAELGDFHAMPGGEGGEGGVGEGVVREAF